MHLPSSILVPLAALVASAVPAAAAHDPAPKAPSWLAAGPMIGHVGPTNARIWLRVVDDAAFTAAGEHRGATVAPWRTTDLGDGFRIVDFEGLEPEESLRVTLAGPEGADPVSLSLTTAPLPADTGTVRFAFGSCMKFSQYGAVPTLRAMAESGPDLALFVGDNSYFIVGDGGERTYSTTGPDGEWQDAPRMLARHMATRTCADFQDLMRTTPCYAIWDDHDYGPNNADRLFEHRSTARRVFQQVWANSSWGTDAVPGIFSRFRRGPVEFFLMDDRYHKWVATNEHPDVPEDERTIWGEDQLQWLFRSLEASTAPVKIIANGTQFMHQGASGEGHWREARHEYRRVLDFLASHDIEGVVFLSGDRHHSELMRIEPEGAAPIMEFTSSPLAQNRALAPMKVERPNPTRVWGMLGDSFGLVTVEVGADGEGSITFECRTADNEVPVLDGMPRRSTYPLSALRR